MSHRIVSLIASATEIVAALGFRDCLVGRSHECDFPPDVLTLPACSEPRIDVTVSSFEIDRQVKAAVAESLSVYRVFRSELERLRPTVVITQTQCDVCAVNLRDVEIAISKMIGSRPRVVSLAPMALADIWDDIQRVSDALADADAGRRLIASLKQRLDLLVARVPQNTTRPTVVCLEWMDPLMSAGNWVPELVELAGGRAVLCQAGQHSPWMTWDDLAKADPDAILILPCGFDLARTERELHLLTEHSRWRDLQAVRRGQVFVTDGNQFFNRPGPRVVESAEIIAEILWPDDFQFGHQGAAWYQLDARPCPPKGRRP